MIYTIILFLLLAIDRGQAERCHSTSEACKYTVTFHYSNGTTDSGDSSSCSCPGGGVCQSGWRRPNYVIKARLRSDVAYTTARYMFCNRFQSTPTCTPGQTAVTMKGPAFPAFPTTLVSYNCRCPDSEPLFFHSSYALESYHQVYNYICDSHKTTCSSDNNVCSRTVNGLTTFPCDCPTGTYCSPNGSEGICRSA